MQEETTFLTQLIQTDTANGHEAAVAALIAAKLAEHGIPSTQLEYAPGRNNLIAELNPDAPGKTLCLSGHQDTVALGDPDKWTDAPLSAAVHDGVLYGRGAADMKSGLAAMVFALIRLHDAGFAGHVKFLATIGEEYGAMGARQLTQAGYANDIDGLVIGEPTLPQLIYGHCGSLNYKVIAHGKSVHSSMPQDGVNAVSLLTDFIVAERTAFDDAPADPVLGPLVHSVTVVRGGEQVNTIPDYAELAGNIRPIPTFNNDQVIARLQSLCRELSAQSDGQLEFELTHSFVPVVTSTDSPLVKAADAAITAVTGAPAKHDIIHGATDASEFVLSGREFDTVIYGPGAWDAAHMIDESVRLTDFADAITTYVKIAEAFCQ